MSTEQQKPQVQITLADLLTQRCVEFSASPKAVEIIDAGIEKMFKDIVDDAFRSYGDFGKLIKDAFKNALPANIETLIELERYNSMVARLMQERWASSGIADDMQAKLGEAIGEFLSDETVPKIILASDLWAAFIEEHQERATEEQWESPQVFYEESELGYLWIGLEPEQENNGRFSSSRKSSAHGCDTMLALSPQINREGRTETPVLHEGHRVYSLFAGHVSDGTLGKKIIKAYSRFDKLMLSMYYGSSLLAMDETPEDISYPSPY